MRSTVLSLVASLLLATAAQAQQTLASEVGGYSLTVPAGFGEPSSQSSPIETAVGQVTMRMKLTQTPNGNNAVMVAYCDYPEAVFELIKGDRKAAVEAMFDSARTGGLRNMRKSKLLNEKKISLNGIPGRSILFSGNVSGKTVYARFDYYIDGVRLYQIGYLSTSRASVESAPIRAMFSSLAIGVPSSTPQH